jgi:hypothetical protein
MDLTKRALGLGFAGLLSSSLIPLPALAQNSPPLTWTTAQDHADMMRQLGIRKLRPAPSGRPDAPNQANYDEAKANPFPDWPELMTLENGRRVTTPQAWWNERRPQIVEVFDREVLGRVPANAPKVTWTVVGQEREMLGRTPVIARQVVGRVDNAAYPAIEVNIQMTLVTPAEAKGPVPVLVMFGRGGYPNPVQPTPEELARLNAALKAVLIARDPALAAFFDSHPAYDVIAERPPVPAPTNAAGDPPSQHQLVAAGWGFASLNPASIQADNGAGLTRGVIGLANRGQARKPDDWGALRAWAWGASRALDYLETDPTVDARRVGVEGVSRWGKTALVAAAYDQRFAVVLVGSSGEGGAKPHRRNFGEAVENLTDPSEYHWMAGNFMKYGAAESSFGSRNAGDIPVDSHQLIALVAPRAAFISYGIPEQGDAHWLDQQGSYMATVAAGPAWRLLGAKDLGVTEDYRTAKMPPYNTDVLDGRLAWRQHDGGHTDWPNMKYFISWASRELGYTPAR